MIIATSLICTCIHAVMVWDGMIFQQFGDWLQERLPAYIHKPAFSCLPCMGLWYGIGAWLMCANADLINNHLLISLMGLPAPAYGLLTSALTVSGINCIILLLISGVRALQGINETNEINSL
jgi:hypothetical protein